MRPGEAGGMTELLQNCHVSRHFRSDCTCPSRLPRQLSLTGASLHVRALSFKHPSLFKFSSVTFTSNLSTWSLQKKINYIWLILHYKSNLLVFHLINRALLCPVSMKVYLFYLVFRTIFMYCSLLLVCTHYQIWSIFRSSYSWMSSYACFCKLCSDLPVPV